MGWVIVPTDPSPDQAFSGSGVAMDEIFMPRDPARARRAQFMVDIAGATAIYQAMLAKRPEPSVELRAAIAKVINQAIDDAMDGDWQGGVADATSALLTLFSPSDFTPKIGPKAP